MTPAKREKVATIIVEAGTIGDAAALKKHAIDDRTLRRYRQTAETDTALADLVRAKRAKVEEGWADELPGALRDCIAFVRRSAEHADPKDPAMLHAIAGAFKLLNDAATTWKVLDARLARKAGTAGAEDRSAPAGAPGTTGRALGLVASNGSH